MRTILAFTTLMMVSLPALAQKAAPDARRARVQEQFVIRSPLSAEKLLAKPGEWLLLGDFKNRRGEAVQIYGVATPDGKLGLVLANTVSKRAAALPVRPIVRGGVVLDAGDGVSLTVTLADGGQLSTMVGDSALPKWNVTGFRMDGNWGDVGFALER